MIVCDLSRVEAKDGEWRIKISRKISGSLGLFEGQTLFGSIEGDPNQLFLSTVRLNPAVNYFRIYLEDVRGSLARITEMFKESNINILSGGAFSLGNLWISEFVVDFKASTTSTEDIIDRIESLGGFVTAREITELFPRSFDLEKTFELSGDGSGEVQIILPKASMPVGLVKSSETYALLNAWPRVKALFITFSQPGVRLLRIKARIRDVVGSLNALADLLKTQVDLQAIDELHHDATSGEWLAFGVLVAGGIEELRERAMGLPTVIGFEVEPLGWEA